MNKKRHEFMTERHKSCLVCMQIELQGGGEMEMLMELVEAWKTAQPWPRFVIWVFLTMPLWFPLLVWVVDKVIDRLNLVERWFS